MRFTPGARGDVLMTSMWETFVDATPARQIGTVEEVAAPQFFLHPDEAAFVNGAFVCVDEGWVADGHMSPLRWPASIA